MRVPEIVMQQLWRSRNKARVRRRKNRLARLHFGNDNHRQRVEGHRLRFFDVHEGTAVMHLAQLRSDVLKAREDIVRSVARVMVNRVRLLVDRQPMLQNSVRIFSGIIDQFRSRPLFYRRRVLRGWLRLLRGKRLNWLRSRLYGRLRRWRCRCRRNRLRALVETRRR